MAFLIKRINNSAVCAPTVKELTAVSGSYEVGDALIISSGKLTKTSATVAPTHICAKTVTLTTAEEIPAYEVEANQEYETELSTAGSLTVGVKYTLADAQKVTATTTSGVAEVVSVAGTTAGSKVVVKF